jgi:hypothetical protein
LRRLFDEVRDAVTQSVDLNGKPIFRPSRRRRRIIRSNNAS